MSPNGHGISVGFWIVSGVLGIGHGHGHMGMDWETDCSSTRVELLCMEFGVCYWDYATQHCASRSHEIVFFIIALHRLFQVPRAM
jgi:hypothetical protein